MVVNRVLSRGGVGGGGGGGGGVAGGSFPPAPKQPNFPPKRDQNSIL